MLAVHGGPGMSYDYLDDAVEELAARYQVATFQQRGLAPSTEQGEFTVAEAVADIAAVLDGLGWETAYLMGHSWGGHLVFHAAARIPERLAGVLSVDPLGAVGDGGAEAFGAEMLARVPEADRERARALDEKDTAGESTPDEDLEAFSPVLAVVLRRSRCCPRRCRAWSSTSRPTSGLWADLQTRLPELESSLPSITVPFGVVVGELSPMPPSAGTAECRPHPRAPGRTSSRGRATSSGTRRRAASWPRWIGSSRQHRSLVGAGPAGRGAQRRVRSSAG